MREEESFPPCYPTQILFPLALPIALSFGLAFSFLLISFLPISLSFFRRDLWVPSAQRPRRFWFGSVRGRGVGPLHWRGPCSLQRAIGLREPEGTQLYHPGLWLWRGTWWHQQQEIAQVRETQYSKHQAFRGPMFCVDTSQIVNLYNHRVLELMGGNVPLSAISVHCVCVLPF